jgi:hypothetical protein
MLTVCRPVPVIGPLLRTEAGRAAGVACSCGAGAGGWGSGARGCEAGARCGSVSPGDEAGRCGRSI